MNRHVDELTGVGNTAIARPDVNPDRNLTIDENQCEQHSAIKSILLHLIPGIPIIVGLFLFSLPFFSKLLGIAVELRVFLGITLSILITLIPVELGILFYEGKKLNGKLSLKGVISFTEKNPLKSYLIFVPLLLVYAIIMLVFVSPLFTPSITETLFAWYPQEYNLQHIWSNPGDLSGYQGVFLLLGLYILINGVLGPFVEELYFRGYLLPRMNGYAGRWAPALNIALFSLYHFFSPWENPIRIMAFLPWGYLVWKKRDIRFSILVHVLMNTGNGIMLLCQILA
ncbi:MAG: type II CAAX endopeptidase family protein [Dehalococcoidales bacterium]|nr:type II CAAX endopeptidase family protein [Dehalococcoidales bacterium]